MICCTRTHTIFKVQGRKASGCMDRPAPSKVNAITERSIRPLISFKKLEKEHCTENTCTYFQQTIDCMGRFPTQGFGNIPY